MVSQKSFVVINRAIEQIKKYGLPLLYWRYLALRKILNSTPIVCPHKSELEIHIQVCKRDWINGIWTLKTFNHFVNLPFRLVLLHDGSLDLPDLAFIKETYIKLFPGVITYKRSDISQLIQEFFSEKYPTLNQMWHSEKFITLPKVLDSFILSQNQYYLSLDPDVMFFGYPQELIDFIHQSSNLAACWNTPKYRGHSDGMYCFVPDQVCRLTNYQLPVPFGTGCGTVNQKSFDWHLVEEVFSHMSILPNHEFMVDQTISGLFAAKYGYEPLPQSRYTIEPVNSLDGVITRHYYSKTRDLMYVQGVRYIYETGIFNTF